MYQVKHCLLKSVFVTSKSNKIKEKKKLIMVF